MGKQFKNLSDIVVTVVGKGCLTIAPLTVVITVLGLIIITRKQPKFN